MRVSEEKQSQRNAAVKEPTVRIPENEGKKYALKVYNTP